MDKLRLKIRNLLLEVYAQKSTPFILGQQHAFFEVIKLIDQELGVLDEKIDRLLYAVLDSKKEKTLN